MIPAVTAGMALALGPVTTAETQTKSSASDYQHSGQTAVSAGTQQEKSQSAQADPSDRSKSSYASEYTAVVWDPVSGNWIAWQGPAGSSQDQSRQQTQSQDRDRSQQTQQWRESREKSEAQRQQAGSQQDGKGSGVVALQGKVQALREVSLRRGQKQPEEHSWVKVSLQSGYEAIVDLGREKDLSDLDLDRGDKIKVWGRHGSIAGQNVLFADRVKIGKEIVNIDRKDSHEEVSGKIRDYSQVSINDEDREGHLLVRFDLDNGQRVIADLGKDVSLDDLEIERDAKVHLVGTRKFADGRQILEAKKIKVEGETTHIDD